MPHGTARHTAFPAALPAEEKARLQVRSDAAGLRHLALHAGAILGLGALIALRAPLWPLLVPVQGVAIAFLFTLQHECTHRTPFASERLNEWVGRIAGLLILQPFTWFRHFHLAHHRWTNDPERDPELEGGKPETPPPTRSTSPAGPTGAPTRPTSGPAPSAPPEAPTYPPGRWAGSGRRRVSCSRPTRSPWPRWR